MGLYNIVNAGSMAAGQPEDISQVLSNFQAIQTILNGGIDNSNINVAAAIVASKLAAYPNDVTKLLRGDGTWSSNATYKKVTAKQVVSSVAPTDLLNGEITIPAGRIGSTGIVRLTAWGNYLSNSGAAQNAIRFALLLGATTLIDTSTSGATVHATNAQIMPWRVTALITNQNATGAQFNEFELFMSTVVSNAAAYNAATGSGISIQLAGVGGYSQLFGQIQGGSAVDTTLAQALILNVTNPVNNAAFYTQLLGATVEIM